MPEDPSARRTLGNSLWMSLLVASLSIPLIPARATAQDQPSGVVVTRVVEREVSTGHRAVGTVMPIRSSTVGSAVDGRVVEFLIDLGDPVTEGQPLARLRTGTLEIELAASKRELELRQAELLEMQNGARPEEVAEADAKMRATRAVQRNTTTRLKRMESLYAQQVANEVDVDDARENAEAAQQNLLAAEALWELAKAGPRLEKIAQAQARFDLQKEQVRLIEDRLEKFTMYAPFDGFITAEHTEVGEWVSQGDPIAEVIALDEVDLRSNVPAEQAVKLQRGRDVRIEFPDLPAEVFTGSIARIVPTADVSTRTFPVNIRLQNRIVDGEPVLLPGMLARAVLPTGQRARMPLVPKDAIVLNGARRSVFIVETTGETKTGRVRSVPVTLGIADGTLIQVEAPLRAGQWVVVLGNERLDDGQEVTFTTMETEPETAAN